MNDFINKLLEMDYQQVPVFLMDALRNPSSNPTAFILILAAISSVVLLVVLVLIVIFISSTDEDSAPEQVEARAPVQATASAAGGFDAEERRRRLRPISGLLWGLAFVAVWVAGGTVSRQDTICLSCHIDGAIHVQRVVEADQDPHSGVLCVSCHETTSTLASVTLAVPGRAGHYIGGLAGERFGKGYGVPVANSTCADCHQQALVGTFENTERGILVSHKEPLAASALCVDCHAPHPGTGVIDRYTVGMDPCMRCHDAQSVSAECSYCHTKDVGYAVRSDAVVTPARHVRDGDCSGCHSLESCDACHGIRLPHSAAFKGAGHARTAVEDIWYNDGKTCKRCHTANRRSCGRCHRSQFPSHPKSYMPKGHQSADPFNNGCDSCHRYNAWMVGRNFCGICHEEYLGGPLPKK